MTTTTTINPLACPTCGTISESDGTPVTTGGWHGDIKYGWGRYAGVHMCRAVLYRCPQCDEERDAEPEWDDC